MFFPERTTSPPLTREDFSSLHLWFSFLFYLKVSPKHFYRANKSKAFSCLKICLTEINKHIYKYTWNWVFRIQFSISNQSYLVLEYYIKVVLTSREETLHFLSGFRRREDGLAASCLPPKFKLEERRTQLSAVNTRLKPGAFRFKLLNWYLKQQKSCLRYLRSFKMHIKSIILEGFKSYAQRTEINGFDPLFNAITGLNGSGKSNILDSICFLLGISNLSHVSTLSARKLLKVRRL